jgi:CRP/FNR family transcriptional regulator, anaerobic regulatory protein
MLATMPNAFVESTRLTPDCNNAEPVSLGLAKPLCERCHLSEHCLPYELVMGEDDCKNDLAYGRRKIRAGERLYNEGDPFEYLFEVRSGNLKSSLTTGRGKEQVSAFHMAGELIGLDGIAYGHHASSATALEDTEVCAISYAFITELAIRNNGFHRTLMKQLSRDTVDQVHFHVRLGGLSSGKRVAAFLLNWSQRMASRGYSPSEFHLRMSRADIASYLGLTLETVCRNFSVFQKSGLLKVEQRHVRIVNLPGLRRVCS